MVGRKRGTIPAALARGRDRFEGWRRTCQVGTRIPEKLWSLAVSLADVHGLSRTASALKLDYNLLKKRVAAKNSDSSSAAPKFIELSPPLQAPSKECIVEFEDGSGARIRVHLRGCDAPDLVAQATALVQAEFSLP